MASKYHSRKTVYEGEKFDSKKELKRWLDLKAQQEAGLISDLQRQVKYTLIPSQRLEGRVVERELSYYADFVYWQNGEQITEDVKGFRTDVYRIKRKLMLYVHGIRIKEV